MLRKHFRWKPFISNYGMKSPSSKGRWEKFKGQWFGGGGTGGSHEDQATNEGKSSFILLLTGAAVLWERKGCTFWSASPRTLGGQGRGPHFQATPRSWGPTAPSSVARDGHRSCLHDLARSCLLLKCPPPSPLHCPCKPCVL